MTSSYQNLTENSFGSAHSSPKVTVLVPAYNAQKYLAECLNSILNQTFKDFELLVINDGSVDATGEILASYIQKDPRVRVVDNPGNCGITYTLNHGLEIAKAPLIARMDADDVSVPTRLEKQVACFDAQPDLGIVSAWICPMMENGKKLTHFGKIPPENDYIAWALLFNNPIPHPVVMFKRELALEIGGYGNAETYAEDYHIWSELSHKAKIYTIPEQLLIYRVHANSVSNKHTYKQSYYASHISKQNMEFLLKRQVELTSVCILHCASNRCRSDYSYAEISQAVQLLENLYQAYLANYTPNGNVKKDVLENLRSLLNYMLLSLPFGQRLALARENAFVSKMLPGKAMLRAILEWKEPVKKMIGKRPAIIIPHYSKLLTQQVQL